MIDFDSFDKIFPGSFIKKFKESMNQKQKIVLVITTAIIILMLLFPPFQVKKVKATFNMGYGFILTPPQRGYITSSVNIELLLMQWFTVFLAGAVAWFLVKDSK